MDRLLTSVHAGLKDRRRDPILPKWDELALTLVVMTAADEHRGGSRKAAALALLVFASCLALYLPTVSTLFVNTDPAANSLAAWHLAHTGQPWMDGLDLREAGKVPHYGPGRDGHMVTTRTPGQIWAAAPFYLGSSADQADWSFVRGGMAAAVLTAGAVALLFLGLRTRVTTGMALGGTAVFAFTTPVWSVSANALWTHPITLLGLGGAVWALSRERWWLVGVWLGVAMTGRIHVAIIAAIVGLGVAWSRRSPAIAIRIGVPTTLSLGVLSLWSYYVFGTWDPRGAYTGHTLTGIVPGVSEGYLANVAGFLVSPDRGLFVWTPLLLLLLPAVCRGWKAAPDWSRWLAVGGVGYSIAQVGTNVFHGGDAFYGYRLALELLVSVTPLYVFCAARAGKVAQRLAPLVIGIQGSAIMIGASVETIVLPEARVWQDNALAWSMRTEPLALVPLFLVTALVIAVGVRHVVARATPDASRLAQPEPTSSDVAHVSAAKG